MPAALWLEEFGSQVWAAFGEPPYLVGSALEDPRPRDIDVRVILEDAEWERWGFRPPAQSSYDGKWVALCMAFSALGKQMTGLPIDFQIQQLTDANQTHTNKRRSALGRVPLRVKLEAE